MTLRLPCLLAAAFCSVMLSSPGGVFAEDQPTAATQAQRVRAAIGKALPLLERAAAGTAENRACFTCHGQALPVMVAAEARRRGFQIDEQNFQRQLDHTAAHLKRGQSGYLAGKGQGGRVDMAGYALWTLEAGDRPADDLTSAVTSYILQAANEDGYWKRTSNRPPSEASPFTTTYLALRSLAAFGTEEQQPEIARLTESAGRWLIEATPADTEDRVFQLRSLEYTDAAQAARKRLADALLAQQREDGGWAQKDDLTSDAYATGTVLTCLLRTGQLEPASEACQRGIRFLLDSQREDGSWHVVSRSKPFQNYFETGFPHGKDQFISTSATGWAAIALLLTLPEQPAPAEPEVSP